MVVRLYPQGAQPAFPTPEHASRPLMLQIPLMSVVGLSRYPFIRPDKSEPDGPARIRVIGRGTHAYPGGDFHDGLKHTGAWLMPRPMTGLSNRGGYSIRRSFVPPPPIAVALGP